MTKKMLRMLPIEIVEYILFYLSVADVVSVLSVFENECINFSDYFWKTMCLREGYVKSYSSQDWRKCFLLGTNLKLGNYTEITDCPNGELKHTYLRSVVTSQPSSDNLSICYVYVLNGDSTLNVMQTIEGDCILFKEKFCLVKKEKETCIYEYNEEINIYTILKILPDNFYDVFGISDEYCTLYNSKQKFLKCYSMKNDECIEILISANVKFVLSKIYHNYNIAISTVSDSSYYEINLYDLDIKSWVLNLRCFGYTGLTNDPNIWLSSNFIACCDISYRARGNYFGPFLVWDKKGNELFRTEIQPSVKHYLKCYLHKENIVLTTSEDTIKVFNHSGDCISALHLQSSFADIQITAGFLVLVLFKKSNYVEVYNLIPESVSLYTIRIKNNNFCKFLNGYILQCVASKDSREYMALKYF